MQQANLPAYSSHYPFFILKAMQGRSIRLVVDRLGFDFLAESDQKTLKVGIHSFPA